MLFVVTVVVVVLSDTDAVVFDVVLGVLVLAIVVTAPEAAAAGDRGLLPLLRYQCSI